MVEIKKELDDDIVVIGLENKDFYVEVTNFGCTLLKAVVKDKEGNPCDCVLGFPEVSDYQKRDGTYLGALVGRVCNRIEKGTFTLNGKTYNVPINNGPNSLHGGIEGFSSRYLIMNLLKMVSSSTMYLKMVKKAIQVH